MIKPNFFRAESSPNSRSRRRRSQGVSRRQRKKQLNFEALEDRRVMSADSLILIPAEALESYSSADAQGANQILLNEIQRYLQQTGASGSEIAARSIPTDPLTLDQWHLINTGQEVGNPDFQPIFGVPGEDINVAPVYNNTDLTGAGVVVAVIDSALQISHPDLAANVSDTLGLNTFNGGTGPGAVGESTHGTNVAGIIGAVANNGIGGTGIAPGVTLVPIELLGDIAGFGNAVDAFRYEIDQIDITNNSWGPPVPRALAGPDPLETLALRDSIFFGRPDENGDALGVIHVFSAGNNGDSIDSTSYDGWVNSRYTIGVTGVDHDGQNNNVDGTNTYYPEIGASVLVAAPTGSNTLGIIGDTFPSAIGSGIYTTDLVGEFGRNVLPDPDTGEEFDRDFLADTDYTSTFNGTSAAAPMVSGVIALMLEANPNLSWRDVQEILVRSSRQNAMIVDDEVSTQADGLDKTFGIEYQNTWIVNQVPLFHDPDVYDPLIDNALQILNPTLDPDLTFSFGFNDNHYAPTPQVLTNGAGYTVSQGRGTNSEATGFAHGVVDAELAVQLAQQWSTKNQHLADELTFTTAFNGDASLPSAEVLLNVDGVSELTIPGGLGGDPGFSAYWAEYYAAVPDFTQGFFDRGAPIELTVPSPNDMTLETLELTVEISGGITEFLDHVRVVLVSPNGTHSELNHYFVDPSFDQDGLNHQVPLAGGLLNANGLDAVTLEPDFINPGSVDTGINTFTFSTNRIWGERSDDAIIFDPSTAEPAGDFSRNYFNFVPGSAGGLSTQGWQIYMENYGTADLVLENFEVAWHGSPIQPDTERVQGLIGIDDNQDDAFNYSRVIQTIQQIDLDPTLRLGEIQNIIDPNHETMAANVTVFAHHDVNANGVLDGADVLVDQFVTGADGNYYFDLVPDDYIISLDTDSLVGLTPLDDSLTPANFLQDYKAEWAISEDFFQVWDYDANLEVPIDPVTDAPFPFLDALGDEVTYGMQHINFLLDPGAPPAQEVVYTGSVIADLNGDGIFNGSDVAVPGVSVFGDVNRNGVFDAGEILATTDATGQYTLTVPLAATAVMNVGVRPPANWTATNPASESIAFFVEPGDTLTDVDFHLLPPAGTSTGDGQALSGIIIGTVFNDSNADGVRQGFEVGVPGQTIYIDVNNSGANDAGDIVTTTNSNGSYAFANLPDGTHFIRIDLAAGPIVQTFPILGFPQAAIITDGGTAIGKDFGLNDTSGSGGGGGGGGDEFFDFGDLPDSYGTRLVDDGARHPKGIFYLGSLIDAETDGVPTADATGDDVTGFPDEDGVVLVGGILDPNAPGLTATLEVTASRHNMFLHGWADFNNDGDFDDTIDGVSEHIIANRLLDAGLNDDVTFDIPTSIVGPNVYVRFRYGEFGLDSTGLAIHGEVEDYQFDVAPLVILGVIEDTDFDDDGDTDGFDFLAWQRGFGTTNATPSDGDANNDNLVNEEDLLALTNAYGQQAPLALAVVESNEPPAQAPTAALSEPLVAEQVTENLVPALSPLALQALESSSSSSYSHDGPVRNIVEVASAALTTKIDSLSEQVASVIDTVESSNFASGRYLASVASEFVRIASDHVESLSPVLARLESAFDANNFVRFDKQHNLRSEVQDFALDRIAAIQYEAAEELLPKRRSEAYSEEVLAEAFDEAFNWRLL